MLTLTKISETASTLTLGWTPPVNVGGYVLYANGQVASVATKNNKNGTPRKSAKFDKALPPFEVAAVCRNSAGVISVEVGTYSEAPPPPPPPTGWTRVAVENGSFTLTESKQVRYGKGQAWNAKTLGPGTFTCDNATFGDPAPGIIKVCQVSGSVTPPPPPPPGGVYPSTSLYPSEVSP